MKGSHSKGILIRLFLFHVIAACYFIGVNKTVKFLGPVLINLIQAPVCIVHKVDEDGFIHKLNLHPFGWHNGLPNAYHLDRYSGGWAIQVLNNWG